MGDIIPGRLGLIRLIHQVTLQATEHALFFSLRLSRFQTT